MSDIASFVSRLSFDRVPPQGAIGIEVWGEGRDGVPNEALSSLVMNVDPQHGGGCWALTPFAARELLPTTRAGWLGSAAATAAQHRSEYALAAARFPSASIWCPRWDADALVAALLLSGVRIPGSIDGVQLAILDGFDSSATHAEIRRSISQMIAQESRFVGSVPSETIDGAMRCIVGSAPAETVGDTIWGAVQALLRAGDTTAAITAAIELLSADSYRGGALSPASAMHPAVLAWMRERTACDAYVREHLEVHHVAACVAGAPQGAWPYALAYHDWAVLSFAGRQGAAHSVAGSRRLPLERRAAIIAAANEALTAAERAAGGSAHWAGAAGITGSRDAASALSPREVAAIVARVIA